MLNHLFQRCGAEIWAYIYVAVSICVLSVVLSVALWCITAGSPSQDTEGLSLVVSEHVDAVRVLHNLRP